MLLGLALVAALLASVGGGQDVSVEHPTPNADSAGNSELPRLVNVDDELVSYLDRAERFIQEQRYSQAARALQALVERSDAGFTPAERPGRYVSLQSKAQDIIARMPSEAMEVYRRLYEPQARRLFEQGLEEDDQDALRRVTEYYPHTSYGPMALDRLARIRFDHGEFGASAVLWRRALESPAAEANRPMLLAKLAVTHHLAGEPSDSEESAERLRRDYPDAKADIAGEQRKLVDFVDEIRARSSPTALADRSVSQADAAHCQVEFRWREPSADSKQQQMPRLIASDLYVRPDEPAPRLHARGRATFGKDSGPVFRFDRGHVVLSRPLVSGLADDPMPPLVSPVIAGKRVIYRTDSAVEARDTLTGALLWRNDELPIVREPRGPLYYGGSNSRLSYTPAERGRYELSVHDHRVFTLAGFAARNEAYRRGGWGVSRDGEEIPSGSWLVALSAVDGSELWRVGHTDDKDDSLRGYTFISAPRISKGRLYVVGVAHDRYYLVCLDAEDGSLLWSSAVSQRPVVALEGSSGELNQYLLETGSPPAVSDGRVYVCTNAGVIAALDAVTGRGLWARRYISRFDSMAYSLGFNRGRNATFPAANPVVVSGGRIIICLPADGRDVLAFSAEGEHLWQRNREQLAYLSEIDESRVLLSGPGLLVLSTVDGRSLPDEAARYSTAISDVRGRPAAGGRDLRPLLVRPAAGDARARGGGRGVTAGA
ncbi:MAG: PQQ-binding-like beta-propeller repeat protein [Planctomycetota bacterium]